MEKTEKSEVRKNFLNCEKFEQAMFGVYCLNIFFMIITKEYYGTLWDQVSMIGRESMRY